VHKSVSFRKLFKNLDSEGNQYCRKLIVGYKLLLLATISLCSTNCRLNILHCSVPFHECLWVVNYKTVIQREESLQPLKRHTLLAGGVAQPVVLVRLDEAHDILRRYSLEHLSGQ
jgi:uncharacterized radical SAM superfamily protein